MGNQCFGAVDLKYRIKLTGATNKIIRDYKQTGSLYKKFQGKNLNLDILKHKIKQDQQILKLILDSYGYYDKQVHLELKKFKSLYLINIFVNMGKRYILTKVEITKHDNDKDSNLPEILSHQINKDNLLNKCKIPTLTGKGINATKLLAFFSCLSEQLSFYGYPRALIKSHTVALSTIKKQATAKVLINYGPQIKMGEIFIPEVSFINNQYIKNRIAWNIGDLFDQRKLDKLHERLNKLNIFSNIDVNCDFSNNEQLINNESNQENNELGQKNNVLPIKVKLTRGKEKSFFAGMYFSRSDGFGIDGGWEHRNITGKGDKLNIATELGLKELSVNINYSKPDFQKINQTLNLLSNYKRKKNMSITYQIIALLKNKQNKFFSYQYGLMGEFSKVINKNYPGSSRLLGVPVRLKYNTSNDSIDPTQGYKINYKILPEFGKVGNKTSLLTQDLEGIYYFHYGKVTYACRSKIKLLLGVKFQQIPLNKRLYSGGSHSIRGYSTDKVSFVDVNGELIGAQSIIEYSVESRLKLKNNWGLALFYDGGLISNKVLSDFSKNIFSSFGLGVRYYTILGPVSFDIAFPCYKRKNIDSNFQFYINIGQSF